MRVYEEEKRKETLTLVQYAMVKTTQTISVLLQQRKLGENVPLTLEGDVLLAEQFNREINALYIELNSARPGVLIALSLEQDTLVKRLEDDIGFDKGIPDADGIPAIKPSGDLPFHPSDSVFGHLPWKSRV